MKRLAIFLLLICACSLVSSAQNDKSRFELSTSFLYSLNDSKTSSEIALAYKFDRAVVKANFDSYELNGAKDVFGESISMIFPSNKHSSDFTLCPEIGAGIAHGKFSGNEGTSVKSQFFLGDVLDYSLNSNLDCGIVMRYCHIGDDSSIFFLGFKIAGKF